MIYRYSEQEWVNKIGIKGGLSLLCGVELGSSANNPMHHLHSQDVLSTLERLRAPAVLQEYCMYVHIHNLTTDRLRNISSYRENGSVEVATFWNKDQVDLFCLFVSHMHFRKRLENENERPEGVEETIRICRLRASRSRSAD